MVVDLQQGLYLITLVVAFLTAVLGILLVNSLFKNKLRELFSDVHFFIFFFLITGYVFSALGELLWYLIFTVFKEEPSASMPDFYWVVGSLLILLSFAAFSVVMHRQHGESRKTVIWAVLGGGILIAVLGYIFSIDVTAAQGGNVFLGYFYPLVSAFIVIFSLSIPLYYQKLDQFAWNLALLFIANVSFLLGDLTYVYTTVDGGYGFMGAASDLLYIIAYTLGGFSFLTMLRYIHTERI